MRGSPAAAPDPRRVLTAAGVNVPVDAAAFCAVWQWRTKDRAGGAVKGSRAARARIMSLSQKLSRLGRIPTRCRNDARLVWMLENWREALAAEWGRAPLKRVKLRNGVELEGP